MQDLTPTINSLIKQKTGVAQLVKYGLKDLEEVVGLLKKLGVKLQVWQLFLPAMQACSVRSGSRGVGFVSLSPVLYFSLKTRLGISLQESLFLSHTHTGVCASGRGLLSESLAGANKQLLPNLSKGFRSCRIIETVVIHIPQLTLLTRVGCPSLHRSPST